MASSLANNLRTSSIVQKWLNNPSPSSCAAISAIEKRWGVSVERFWSECYHCSALCIQGEDTNVMRACEEFQKIERTLSANGSNYLDRG